MSTMILRSVYYVNGLLVSFQSQFDVQIQSNSIIVEKMVNANLSTILNFSTILDFCVVQGN